ncbi:hypothetical protein DJ71_02185, partial [Halorubrum sp. E3]
EDRSLDEFGGAGADTGAAETGTAGGTDDETETTETPDDDSSSAEPDDGESVEEPPPATATATWTAGGADCERCGDRVERRWLDDGDRVCPDCKSW